MLAAGLGEQAREWEADLTTGMRGKARQVGEGQMWRALKNASVWTRETYPLAYSSSELVPFSQERRPDIQGLNISLLSGLSVMLESSCGQRKMVSACYPHQTSGCFLGLSLSLTQHV